MAHFPIKQKSHILTPSHRTHPVCQCMGPLTSGGSVKSPTDRITVRTIEKKITDNRPTKKLGITENHRKSPKSLKH